MISSDDIRAERARKRLTQQELADKAGIGLGTVIRIEAGGSSFDAAGIGNVKKIAAALGLE